MKGNNKSKKQAKRKSRTMRAGVMGLLCVAGVGSLLGMAVFNGGIKPNRDMQWYVREGALEVAAPALGEGYASAEEASEFVLPEEGLRQLPTVEPVATLEPVEASADMQPEEGFSPRRDRDKEREQSYLEETGGFKYEEKTRATTNLGDLLKGIKL